VVLEIGNTIKAQWMVLRGVH